MYGSMFNYNNATNTGGGMHISLYGEDSTYGQSCFKVLNLNFSNNYAGSGGKDAFLQVTDGFHNVLSSETELTTLCSSGTCASIESVLNYMCIQQYALSSGPCFNIEQDKTEAIANGSDYDWVSAIEANVYNRY